MKSQNIKSNGGNRNRNAALSFLGSHQRGRFQILDVINAQVIHIDCGVRLKLFLEAAVEA